MINLLAFDMYGWWENQPQLLHHSALHSLSNRLTTASMINELINYGVSADSILLGLSSSGRSLRVANKTKVTGPGVEAAMTLRPGVISFFEICQSQIRDFEFNKEEQVPNGWIGDDWIGFDDTQSFTHKVSTLQ